MNDADKPIDWEEEALMDDGSDRLHAAFREVRGLCASYDNRRADILAIRILERFEAGARQLCEC